MYIFILYCVYGNVDTDVSLPVQDVIYTHAIGSYSCDAVIGDDDGNSNGSSDSSNPQEYRNVIIGSCVGAFVLIVLICAIIVYIRSK